MKNMLLSADDFRPEILKDIEEELGQDIDDFFFEIFVDNDGKIRIEED